MYIIKVEHHFDSAHFLAGYSGKCANIHGHRWRVEVEVAAAELIAEGQCRGMVADFSDLKRDVRETLDFYDHALIIEEGTLRKETLTCLEAEGFRVIKVKFRPTAENFSRFFYQCIGEKGHRVKRVTVYETPVNCSSHESDEA
ncbi:6-carboxytetrahydropterin synthase QueD [Petroclostridium sp. X23]|uniref:6-carboxytetrahydropterin synthase QueD n=1 Tax=Petroclostridium sp. X23 TaxID=3045146 RepID=UPI0024AE5379|nr:6-carboxytetrahydropterin synthase QueD [Petroclostridium sp. X23]WHH60234.1 6-carboxytetrahydropterin synthase QueD [Petroclostridium sp. X23]